MRYLFPDGSEAGAVVAAKLDIIHTIPQSQWTDEQAQFIASVQQWSLDRMKALEEAKHGRE